MIIHKWGMLEATLIEPFENRKVEYPLIIAMLVLLSKPCLLYFCSTIGLNRYTVYAVYGM